MTEQYRLNFNARRIIAALRTQGPQSRADLARHLDIMPSTVTRLIKPMVDGGLLSEEPDPRRLGMKGYPARLLSLRADGMFSAGVYIDPDRILTCITDLVGNVLAVEENQVPERSFEGMMTVAGNSVQRLIDKSGIERSRLAGCGVSYPGQYSTDPTQVYRIRQFRDWPRINVLKDLTPFFGMPVKHMNDAKAASLAELYHGACRNVRNFCHVWLSYGIGGAAVIDQRLYLGRNRLAAEWGGLFPKSKSRPSGQDLLDTLARNGVTLERLNQVDAHHLDMPIVRDWRAQAAEQMRWLCLVIARTYAPDAIVIGGTLHPEIIKGFISHIQDAPNLGEDFFVTPPRILAAEQDSLPQLGAAALPIHEIFNPATFEGQASKGW
ncbi:ROK family transcriptional regulator [Oceanibium sediminis]|uniref:ROK family transcriptional regulator n=1 Tax=Oceanibium sediminis TaxID=2026339 RepID=UPI000DD2B73A|nr:ROK family transcriptional regulator [Oceanibium sediminis]